MQIASMADLADAPLTEHLHRSRREFLRARRTPQGGVELFAHQGSGVLTSASWADGVVDLPPQTTVQPGDVVRWIPAAELLHPASAERQP